MSTITKTRRVRGKVELADPASVADNRYANPELLPVPLTVTKKGKKTVEVVYLITSDRRADAATLAARVRATGTSRTSFTGSAT